MTPEPDFKTNPQSDDAVETLPILDDLLLPAPPELEEIDPEAVVEEAELLLRESAPHDFDVLVLGAGPGGYVAAIRAAQLGARVGLVEEREVGGVCLNRGCIPTKSLLESVDVMRLLRRAEEYGIEVSGTFKPNMAQMNARRKDVVAQLRGNVEHLLRQHQVETVVGRARFLDGHTVEVRHENGVTREIRAVHVIIATGGVPLRLPVDGADLPGVITSDELLQSDHVPRHLAVIGGGAVGVEFAYLYKQLGAQATLLEMAPMIMASEDEDISREMTKILQGYGVAIETNAKLLRIEATEGDEMNIVFEREGREETLRADWVLMAAGRKANTQDLGLEEAGIKIEKGRVVVDEKCETSVGGVYAIGDVTRDVGWAHQAAAEGKAVAERIMDQPVTIDLEHVPSCYYTHPEIASAGKTKKAADEAGLKTRVGIFQFRANGRAASAGDHEGFVKVVIDDVTEKLLGCQIIGPRATDLISEAVLALKTGQTVDELVGAIHAHPTFSEALPEAALAARGLEDLAD